MAENWFVAHPEVIRYILAHEQKPAPTIETETARDEYEDVMMSLVLAQFHGELMPDEAQRIRDDYTAGFLLPEE